jgi:hypothetical protein
MLSKAKGSIIVSGNGINRNTDKKYTVATG